MVEDSPDDAELLLRTLRSGGYDPQYVRVETAEEMREALAEKSWDLVISDFSLPHFSAPHALTTLQESGIDIPFIIVSGAIGEETAVENMRAGAHDFVVKGSLARLVPAIERELRDANVRREQREGVEALRKSEEKYRSLFEELKEAVFMSTVDGKLLDCNPAFVELMGYPSKEEMLKLDNMRSLYSDPEYFDHFKSEITKAGFVKNFEVVLKRPDGKEVFALHTATAIRDETGSVVAYQGIIHDLTERNRLEQQLFQAQKMEAVGQLAGGVAHDFNNILTTIVLAAGSAMEYVELSHPAAAGLRDVLSASNRAANLTRQLLIFSSKQAVRLIPLKINRVLDDILKMLGRIIGDDIKVDVETSSDLWTITADSGNMDQLIMNLVVNARDAMAEGGTIAIKTENIELDAAGAERIEGASPGRFICLSVEDSGEGMDEETLANIFDPFFTTKKTGTGLGLAVVHGIIKNHGGWVNVSSKPGRGTTFRVYLPALPGAEVLPTTAPADAVDLRGYGERIMFVEDEQNVRELTVQVLSNNGYVVFEAENAEEALKIFAAEGESIDLLLSDVVLPGRTGVELVDELLVLKPDLRVMLTSGHLDNKAKEVLIEERGFRFISKPYTMHGLLAEIKATLKTVV